MIEIAWDCYLMKIYDPEKREDLEEINAMSNSAKCDDCEWQRLDQTSNYDKNHIRDIISALNYTKKVYGNFVDKITQIGEPQWVKPNDDVIPSPIPHPDVSGVQGPPKPDNAIL